MSTGGLYCATGMRATIVISVSCLLAAVARAQAPLCPTWEPCGEGGVRCYHRGLELRAGDEACAAQFFDAACEAGSGGACFELGAQAWARGERGAGVRGMSASLAGDVVHEPWLFYRAAVLPRRPSSSCLRLPLAMPRLARMAGMLLESRMTVLNAG